MNVSRQLNPEKRPLIVFGQAECIVKQYFFTHKSWNGPNCKHALIPKDDGLGRMIPAFVGAYTRRTCPMRECGATC